MKYGPCRELLCTPGFRCYACRVLAGGNIIGLHPFKLEHAQRLNSLLRGTHVLPPAPEDPESVKQCEAKHRQFKLEKPRKNNL